MVSQTPSDNKRGRCLGKEALEGCGAPLRGPGQGGQTVRTQTVRQVASVAASRLCGGAGHAHTRGPDTAFPQREAGRGPVSEPAQGPSV